MSDYTDRIKTTNSDLAIYIYDLSAMKYLYRKTHWVNWSRSTKKTIWNCIPGNWYKSNRI